MSDQAPLSPQEPGLSEEVAPQAPSIGDRLRQARERRGVSIAEASATLKIRAPILEAFEREDHSQLPPQLQRGGKAPQPR
jgi:ribosome-binding protein aMBF1 (putative translation factor)